MPLRRGSVVLWALLLVLAVAIAAGALFRPGGWTPADRAARTRRALDAVAAALGAFERDTGHLPGPGDDALDALLTGGGEPGWRGPYAAGPEDLSDGWGYRLVYRPAADGSSAVVASPGADLERIVVADSAGHRATTARRLSNLVEALRVHRADEGRFPASLDALDPALVRPTDRIDGWGRPFEMTVEGPVARVASRGADGTGDGPSALVGVDPFPLRPVLELRRAGDGAGAVEVEHDGRRLTIPDGGLRIELLGPGDAIEVHPTGSDAPPVAVALLEGGR